MSITITINGTVYSDGASTAGVRGMADGGHRDNLVPMLADAVAAVGSASTAASRAEAARSASEVIQSAILAVAGEDAGINREPLGVPRNMDIINPLSIPVRGIYTRSVAAAATLSRTDFGKLIVCGGTTYTVTLPPAADCGPGWWVMVQNNASGSVTIDGDGSETINGATTKSLPAGAGTRIVWSETGAFVAIGA
jgi:hypothetical protein